MEDFFESNTFKEIILNPNIDLWINFIQNCPQQLRKLYTNSQAEESLNDIKIDEKTAKQMIRCSSPFCFGSLAYFSKNSTNQETKEKCQELFNLCFDLLNTIGINQIFSELETE